MKNKSIYLAVLNQGYIASGLTDLLTLIVQNDAYKIYLSYPNQKPITYNRNNITQKFLATDADYLMMIDSDVIPPPNILNLVDFDKDIITPLMLVKQKGMLIPLFLKMNKDGIYDTDDYINKVGLQECDATGTGCIIIKRNVLEKLKHPFQNKYDQDGIKTLGQDFYFCQRAKELGFKVWVHLDYIAEHLFTDSLREQFYYFLKDIKRDKEYLMLKDILKEEKPKLYSKIIEKLNEKMLQTTISSYP